MMGAVRPSRKERPQKMVDAMERGQEKETTYTMMGAVRPSRKERPQNMVDAWKEGKRRRQHKQLWGQFDRVEEKDHKRWWMLGKRAREGDNINNDGGSSTE